MTPTPTQAAQRISIPAAFVSKANEPVSKSVTRTWTELSERLRNVQVGDKDGPGWMPALIEPGARTAERVKAITALVLDIEADAKKDPATGVKTVVGPEPLEPETMAAELSLAGWACILHTSHTHHDTSIMPTGQAHPRYRLVFQLSRHLAHNEIKPLGLHVASLLGIGDCIDAGCLEPARLFYLPRCPAERLADFRHFVIEGSPLDVDALLADAGRASSALATATKQKRGNQSGGVIDAFNKAHDVGAILESHGYIPKGRNRWTHPDSTTGMPGVRMLPDSERVYSSHGCDPLNDSHAHDAFDCWRILNHNGDMTDAIRKAARILGMSDGVQRSAATPQLHADNAPAGDPDAWPEPQPIPCMLLPVDPFDNDLLPMSLRGWVADIAERMQCPPDFPAVGAMVALSSIIGRKATIRPKRFDDWQVVPNLWGAIVGRPGVMKSPALSEVMKPLDRLAIIASDLHTEVMRDHEIKVKLEGMSSKTAESQAQKLVAKGNKSAAAQLLMDAADTEGNAPPPLRRYKVTDASVEALGEILIENPWGTLAYRDELNGLLRSLDKEGQEGARAFYLQGYDGNQGYTFDRIMRGRNLHIPAVCIAMLGGIQPGKLQSYIHDAVSGGAGDDGLLQRFGLLVWPDVCGEWRNVDRWPDTPAKRMAFEIFQRLDAMAPGADPESGEDAPVVYRFSDEAQTLFEEWRQEFETALRSGDHHPAMESHLSKYRKLVPAIALVCALADGETEVSRDSLLRALAWSDYLQSHAKRAYAAGTRPATEGATALLAKIKAGAVADSFKPADVYLKGWAHLATPESTHAAISMLCDLHHLRMSEKRPGSTGGRPSITYQINPATMGGE